MGRPNLCKAKGISPLTDRVTNLSIKEWAGVIKPPKAPTSILHVNSFNKTRQSKATTPEDNFFFLKRKNELPQAGFEPTTFCVLGRHSTNCTRTCTCSSRLTHCRQHSLDTCSWRRSGKHCSAGDQQELVPYH